MQLHEAVDLISSASLSTSIHQHWLDLGCGSGLFTIALAELLPASSTVTGVDQINQNLPEAAENGNRIRFHQANFQKDDLPFISLDGILMANSFHYVFEKEKLITALQKRLKPQASFIIVEYDTEQSNPWVPYPVSFQTLQRLFQHLGYTKIQKLGERESRFRKSKLYAAQTIR